MPPQSGRDPAFEPGASPVGRAAEPYGAWTHHRVPDDRADWHPLVREFYEYWLSAAPPDALPGRQHIRPERIASLLPRLWMLDVQREPLRFRYRLAGTAIVRFLRREVTGVWLDEAHPDTFVPETGDRYRFIAETGGPTWRRGPTYWDRPFGPRVIENCAVPLAADGRVVDKILALTVGFDANGELI